MNVTSDTPASYHEEQRFRQPWLWGLLLLSALAVVAIFGYGMVRQLVYGQPWGDRPMSDTALVIVGGLLILLIAAVTPWFMYTLRLVTEVRPDGLHLRLVPFLRRRIAFEDIRRCEARWYSPLREYGGWGIRWGLNGTAYNVSGNRGVQLELANGKRLLIGSQRADELAQAIQAALRR